MPVPIFIFNAQGKIMYINKETEKIYGYSKTELKSLFLADLGTDQEDIMVHQKVLKFAIENRGKRRLIRKHKKKDGTLIDVDVQWKTIDIGEQVYILSCVREITEQQEVLRTYERSVELMAKIVKDLTHSTE
ncbi:MAG: PAS domain S-box protein [Thermotaleaceae bacterium]